MTGVQTCALPICSFVAACRNLGVTPHVAQNSARAGGSAIDGRTTRHVGYEISQRIRKRIETIFGDAKQHRNARQFKVRGKAKADFMFTLTIAVSNLVRMAGLMRGSAMAATGMGGGSSAGSGVGSGTRATSAGGVGSAVGAGSGLAGESSTGAGGTTSSVGAAGVTVSTGAGVSSGAGSERRGLRGRLPLWCLQKGQKRYLMRPPMSPS